ncbi:hypothetical protein ACFLWS_05060 [Chloroflexota bacterium]
MEKTVKVSRGKAKKRSDSTERLLKVAHRKGIITEWAPLLTREKINRACLEYGPAGVVHYLRDEWIAERPTTNYCWVVSEVAYRLVRPEGTTCWRVDVTGDGFYHWFLKDPDGTIVDLTLDQAEGWWEIPEYEKAKRYYFRPAMSRRGKKLAELLGILGAVKTEVDPEIWTGC